MELNAIQLAGLTAALATLKDRPEYSHPIPLLRRIGGDEVVKEVKSLHGEYVQANKDAESGGIAMLSGDSAAYWEEARGVLVYGRLIMSKGDKLAGKGAQTLSLKCESLDESFVHRVPPQEQGMFLVFDINSTDGSNWDDRWHACRDYNFPLLRADLGGSTPVKHPMNEAQGTVLAAIVCPIPDEPTRDAKASQWGKRLRALARDAEDSQTASDAAAARKIAAVRKANDTASKKAARDALIAAGDQKETKRRRKREYKLVKDEAWITDPETPAEGS
ncbi:hypothetical protein [Sphingomonas aerolata]|uniref:hypothetical protein n=1 Tax=Sphingomonas aerolata TaxID=185951 RepID=UPI003348F1D3